MSATLLAATPSPGQPAASSAHQDCLPPSRWRSCSVSEPCLYPASHSISYSSAALSSGRSHHPRPPWSESSETFSTPQWASPPPCCRPWWRTVAPSAWQYNSLALLNSDVSCVLCSLSFCSQLHSSAHSSGSIFSSQPSGPIWPHFVSWFAWLSGHACLHCSASVGNGIHLTAVYLEGFPSWPGALASPLTAWTPWCGGGLRSMARNRLRRAALCCWSFRGEWSPVFIFRLSIGALIVWCLKNSRSIWAPDWELGDLSSDGIKSLSLRPGEMPHPAAVFSQKAVSPLRSCLDSPFPVLSSQGSSAARSSRGPGSLRTSFQSLSSSQTREHSNPLVDWTAICFSDCL